MLAPLVETDAAKKDLPPHRVLREDPAFLPALRPGEAFLGGSVVMQSMELLHAYREVVTPPGAVADPAFIDRMGRHMAFSFDVDALAEPFPAPVLILCGRQDNICGYREAYRLLGGYPRATYAALDCAGHFLPVEREALFRSLASEWLDRVEAWSP
jgi:pimeloyl-ACP methyl ester carboxylesterase